ILLDTSSSQSFFSLRSFTVDGVAAALIIAGFFAIQFYVSKGRWIGFGDVKLGLFLGCLLGIKLGLIMLLIAYWLGAVSGLILVGLGKKNLGSKLPFGSFLSLSAIIIILYGQLISNWYFRLLGL